MQLLEDQVHQETVEEALLAISSESVLGEDQDCWLSTC